MQTSAKTFSFGDFELDVERRLLCRRGEYVPLNPKTFELLLTLLENRGRVISKNELLDTVWADQFVEENNLTVHIAALRKALGEKKNENRFIVTVPGRGYSFVAEVAAAGKPFAVTAAGDLSFGRVSETDGLIGREAEVEGIVNLLADENACLIILTGTGGCGKTALARAVAVRSSEAFPDGVFFVELDSIRAADLVAPTVANALGIEEAGGRTPPESIRNFLGDKKILLVLDNFEQLIPAAGPLVGEILAAAENLKILITSRIAPRIENEREFALRPLAVPADDSGFSGEDIGRYAAVRLFLLRARAARPSFALTQENAPAIAAICRRLDGLPLAVELAAARTKMLGPPEILARLENSLKLLSGGAKGLSARRRTMHGAIEWSYELLEDEEKMLFRRLSVFSGGFTVGTVEAVFEEFRAEASGDFQTDLLDLLAALIDGHLLEASEQKDGTVRLRLLEVIREFALACLRESGETEALREAHALRFLKLAEEAEPHLTGERSAVWLETLETEIKNIRAAFEWLLPKDPEKAARLAGALRYFWSNRNYLSEGRERFEKALEKSAGIDNKIRFKLLNALGQFARSQGDYAAAEKFNEAGLSEGRAANDLRQMCISAHGLAAVAARRGDLSKAWQLNQEELTLARELADAKLIAYALSALSDLALIEGETETARRLIEESLALSEGNTYLQCINRINLGTVECRAQNFETAAGQFADALSSARSLENKTLISCVLDGLAAVSVAGGNIEQAATLAGAAEKLRETVGYEIEPAERAFRDSYLVRIRAAIDEKSFDAAFREGRDLHITEVLTLTGEMESLADEQITEIIIEKQTFERIVIEDDET